MNTNRISIFFIFAVVMLSACAGDAQPAGELEQIRLPMGFIPNIQYAPYYVAVEKGYFTEAGFELEFDYRFETDGVALVGSNQLPFALVSGEQVLLARAQEIPVVYIMAWFQDYPIAIVSKADRGITTIQDLAGKQIGIPGLFGASYIVLLALLNAGGISEQDVTLDSIDFTQVEALSQDREDAVVGYLNNEPIQLRSLGYEVNLITVADYVELAANGLITNQSMIQDNPKSVQRFVQAALQGLVDTIANPDEAYEISLKYVEGLAEADKTVQKQVLAKSIELWQADTLGFSNPKAWENMQTVLLDMGLLTSSQILENAFTNEFIK
ncbi:MAG: ABC transporter substrate-binding protein [Chloroflexota bacterium]